MKWIIITRDMRGALEGGEEFWLAEIVASDFFLFYPP